MIGKPIVPLQPKHSSMVSPFQAQRLVLTTLAREWEESPDTFGRRLQDACGRYRPGEPGLQDSILRGVEGLAPSPSQRPPLEISVRQRQAP